MWLLDTHTLDLKSFVSPETVSEPYAILSHCWDDKEQSHQELQTIHQQCTASQADPRTLICPKIQGCCSLARQHGYRWVWIDTCCIDKTSSAELSEAINSMYRYYALASVCYAYLRDVPSEGTLEPDSRGESRFARSKWHTRGWTLQELIAPRFVLLVSRTWDVLGSKADLAQELESITRIPASVLRLARSPSDSSIAQRMSWAASRTTTRLEDEAYCLLGLFGINMPTLYGEGRNAFRRLQEEIMRTSDDTTLFAWGDRITYTLPDRDAADKTLSVMQTTGLFAAKPADFAMAEGTQYTPEILEAATNATPTSGTHNYVDDVMSFTLTPHGVRVHLPIFAYSGQLFACLGWSITLVDSSPQSTVPLLLPLQPEPSVRGLRASKLPLYSVGSGQYSRNQIERTVMFAAPTAFNDWVAEHLAEDLSQLPMTYQWQDLYIVHSRHPIVDSDSDQLLRVTGMQRTVPMDYSWSAPVRISSLVSEPLTIGTGIKYVTVLGVSNVSIPWTGKPAARITVRVFPSHPNPIPQTFVILLGTCENALRVSGSDGVLPAPLWATVQHSTFSDREHDCGIEHVLTWPNLEKTFRLTEPQLRSLPGGLVRSVVYSITISLSPCQMNPRQSLALRSIHISCEF